MKSLFGEIVKLSVLVGSMGCGCMVQAQVFNYDNGSMHFNGSGLQDSNIDVQLGGDSSSISSTNSNASEREASQPTQNAKTAAAATYNKIKYQPIQSLQLISGLENIGQDFTPLNEITGYQVNNGVVATPFTFNSSTSFTPLEAVSVNDVSGYLGSASSGGSIVTSATGTPAQFFVPNDQLKKTTNVNYSRMTQVIENSNRNLNQKSRDPHCAEDTSPYPEDIVKQTTVPRKNGYLPGCQALAVKGGPTAANETQLQQCLQSIKQAVASVSRKNGSIDRSKWMCNVMAQLNPVEQDFAGLIFTSAVEAGVISTSKSTGEPKWKETAFVMKVMENRTRQAKSDLGSQFNNLDIALSPMQFSMYNKSEFNKFLAYFEPNSKSGKGAFDMAIKGYIALKNKSDLFEPKPLVDNMDMYFNPNGMAKGSNKSQDGRTRSQLVAGGDVPSNYPNNRRVPAWDFKKLTYMPDLAFDGRKVRSAPPYRHAFYSTKSGKMFYGGNVQAMKERRNTCGKQDKAELVGLLY